VDLIECLIKYADAYDEEKEASKAFGVAFGNEYESLECEEIRRLKSEEAIGDFDFLFDDKPENKKIKDRLKQEAFLKHIDLWEVRKEKRVALGAMKRAILMRARKLREATPTNTGVTDD
jgi:hypothetical protein